MTRPIFCFLLLLWTSATLVASFSPHLSKNGPSSSSSSWRTNHQKQNHQDDDSNARRRDRRQSSSSRLYELIRGEAPDGEEIDFGRGGVQLAQESAIKIVGDIRHKPGNAESRPSNLIRYTGLQPIDNVSEDVLQKAGIRVLASGQGVELYKDPGTTTVKEVYYAPNEAIKDALTTAASAMQADTLVFNFLGGDDLMADEVLEAANELVLMLDIATKAKISFNSLCHSSIPSGTCTVTVVEVLSGGEDNGGSIQSGVEKAIASGEVYLRDGVWYTVVEDDINTALA